MPSPTWSSTEKWLDQLRNDSTRPIGDLWRRAVDRRHGGGVVQRRDGPRRLRDDDDDDDYRARL